MDDTVGINSALCEAAHTGSNSRPGMNSRLTTTAGNGESEPMPDNPKFSHRFASPIHPAQGPLREIATLYDAFELIAALEAGKQAAPIWERTAKLMVKASQSGRKVDIGAARTQLLQALRGEGWL